MRAFGGEMGRNEPGRVVAHPASAPADCADAVCGNGETDPGEKCDDGNLNDGDGCTSACARAACEGEAFASTWEAIRTVVFDRGRATGRRLANVSSCGPARMPTRGRSTHRPRSAPSTASRPG